MNAANPLCHHMRKAALLIAAVALTACAQVPEGAPASSASATPAPTPAFTFRSQTVNYRCEGGGEIEVAYLHVIGASSFAAIHHGGRTVLLQSRRTGSGLRYIALDEQYSLRWYTQGMKGMLAIMAADHTAQEQTLLGDCMAQPARR